MAAEEDLVTFYGRLATFNGPHQLPKRRASATAKRKNATTVEWPHKSPSPEQLARAGFYYKPDSSSDDNVACWLCQKNIAGWEPADNPPIEHLSHVPHCGWAINICVRELRDDMDRPQQDPMSQELLQARRATFSNFWPHEKKRGWKCKTEKMVEAGFCYNPLSPGDDYVTCYYCDLSLDGWEPKDDPVVEHQKRSEECRFFSLCQDFAPQRPVKSKKASKAKARASKSSRESKASRLSNQSAATFDLEEQSSMHDDTDLADEGDTVLTTGSTASRPRTRKPRSAPKVAAKKTVRGTRGRKKAEVDQSQIEETAMEAPDEPFVDEKETASTKTRTKRSTAKSKKSKPMETMFQDSSLIDESSVETNDGKGCLERGKNTKKFDHAGMRANDEGLMEEDKLEKDLSPPPPSHPNRGRKRSSDGTEKDMDSSVLEVPSKSEQPKAKPSTKRTRATKQKTADKGIRKPDPDSETDNLSESSRPLDRLAVETNPTPTPAVLATVSGALAGDLSSTSTPRKRGEPQQSQSSPSAQSSDAENQPPSSRPSLRNQAGLSKNGTTEAAGAATPRMSPSKRNQLAGGLSSLQPWQLADLESAILSSPSSRQLIHPRLKTVESILQALTSPERQMSVEEWIMKNAGDAEQRLRDDCEQMISKFESEGMRALQTLEGIISS